MLCTEVARENRTLCLIQWDAGAWWDVAKVAQSADRRAQKRVDMMNVISGETRCTIISIQEYIWL